MDAIEILRNLVIVFEPHLNSPQCELSDVEEVEAIKAAKRYLLESN